ncbi:MAG: glycosyltransferase [Candidatus Njordarchaeales archaeon]
MKRIGFLFLHPLAESLGSTTRVLEIAKSLNNNGFEVVIYDPFEKTQEIDGILIKKLELFGSLNIFFGRIYNFLKKVYYNEKTRKITTNKIFQKNFLYQEIAKKLVEKVKKDNIQILIIEQDFAIVPGVLAAEEAKIPAIIDIHNITAEELVAAGVLSYKSEEFRKMQDKLGELLQKVDGVIVVSEALKNYVKEIYGVKKDIVVVPPAGRPRISEVPERPLPYKFIYAGLITYREKVDLFVRSIPYLKEKIRHFEVYMTKKGEELEKVKKINKNQKLGINFFWFETRNKLFEFMKMCHVGILTSSRNKARILGPPIKLYDYMSVGLPVVANDVGGWCEIIKKEKIGIITDDNPKSFAEGIYQLIQDEALYYKYANNALRVLKEKYSWDKVVEPLVFLIERML